MVNADIAQFVEIREDDNARLGRLLELLAEFGDAGKVLVFVNSQDKCIKVFEQLLNNGYSNKPLHGAMEQVRRLQLSTPKRVGG